jgi:hypothetical protein
MNAPGRGRRFGLLCFRRRTQAELGRLSPCGCCRFRLFRQETAAAAAAAGCRRETAREPAGVAARLGDGRHAVPNVSFLSRRPKASPYLEGDTQA